MKHIFGRLTYANVMATVAVFIALGGASYAAIKLPKNSVGTKQLKNGAVSGAKIKKGAVTASRLAPGTITGAIDPATLGTVKSATNATHATSADTATSAATATTLQGQSPAQIAAAAKLRCPTGTRAVGGLCFDSSPRPTATYARALQTCGEAGMELPDDGELALFFVQTQTRQQFGWTASHYFQKSFEASVLVAEEDGTISVGVEATGGNHVYWCVTTPRN